MPTSRAFFFNSAFAFASAVLLTAAFHEAGHGFAAQALGFSPKIYAFYEDNPVGAQWQNLIILAAGPITSLLIGVAVLAVYRRGRSGYSFGRLLLFWIAWLGVMQFLNYIIVTPWLAIGDTAQIANILGWPIWARYAIAAGGILVLLTLGRPAAESMFACAPPDVALETRKERRRFVMRGFYLPLMLGVLLIAPGGIGGRLDIVALGLLDAFGFIDFVVCGFYSVGSARVPQKRSGPVPRLAFTGIALWLALVAFYIVAIRPGLPV